MPKSATTTVLDRDRKTGTREKAGKATRPGTAKGPRKVASSFREEYRVVLACRYSSPGEPDER